MITIIDLHHPAIIAAMRQAIASGDTVKLAEIPAGGTAIVRESRFLQIDDGQEPTFSIDIATDDDLPPP